MQVEYKNIIDAYQFLKPKVLETPIFTSPTTDRLLDKKIYFKMENFQKTGSFKIRGATYKLSNLSEDELSKGVLAVSAGNHAQGVASAATNLGSKATIFMPENTPQNKIDATNGYGGRVILAGKSFGDTAQYAQDFLQREPLVYISAFDDPYIIAGQGSLGIELFMQKPELDTVVVPVGGGGLISGVALALKTLNPKIKIIGVEVEAVPSMKLSTEAGYPVTADSNPTIAEGIAVETPGEICVKLVQEYVDELVTVTEEQVAEAISWYFERMKAVVEGAGAATLAALFYKPEIFSKSDKIGLVVSGGNLDMTNASNIRSMYSHSQIQELEKRLLEQRSK